MTKEFPEKLPLTSMDVPAEKRAELRELLAMTFPEAVADQEIDFDLLRRVLGAWVEPNRERFGLNWPGKAACMKVIQAPSVGTLKPCLTESVDWGATQNIFIEGDNLEVLKLLQKAYFGRIKMIYIDPPYNTGKEFIYPDKYSESLDTYLSYTGQRDAEGRKFSTNTDAQGRFHSRWLSMMYPRLYLARNLLNESGLIFVSISDHEVAHLRAIMNDVFGEENFVAQIVWKSRKFPDSRAKTGVSTDHEYVLLYARSEESPLRGVERDETKFANPDGDSRGPWMSRSILGLATRTQRPNLHYEVVDPKTGWRFNPPEDTGWRYGKERMEALINEGSILFPPRPEGRPREKKFRADLLSERVAFPSIIDDVFTSDGTAEIRALFGEEIFDFAKPSALIARLIQQGTSADDIVLDFFAGSGTTAHAVMAANFADGGRRRYILAQLPEPTDREDYPTIAAMARERIRRSADLIARQRNSELDVNGAVDFGFAAFELATSNFKRWNGDVADDDDKLEQRLSLHADHLEGGRTPEDILYEILLKDGFPLDTPTEVRAIGGKTVYAVAGGELLICLDRHLDQTLIDALADLSPSRVVCLDAGFAGNDQLKANAVQTFKARARSRETAIEFRTV